MTSLRKKGFGNVFFPPNDKLTHIQNIWNNTLKMKEVKRKKKMGRIWKTLWETISFSLQVFTLT